METGARPCVAGHPFLVNQEEESVPIAIESNRADPLAVSRALPLDPNLIATAAEICRARSIQSEP